MSSPIWILSGVRTPFAKAGGPLRDMPVYELGRIAVGEVVARSELDPGRLDEVILGQLRAARRGGQHGARDRAARRSPGAGSRGHGAPQLRLGNGIRGDRSPAHRGRSSAADPGRRHGVDEPDPAHVHGRVRALARRRDARQVTAPEGAGLARFRPRMLAPRIALAEGLTDLVCGLNMGQTAEVLAREFRVTRERQDAFALQSHHRAIAGRDKLREEIVPVFAAPRPSR